MYFLEVAAAGDITALLDILGSVFTFLMGQVGTLVDLVMSHALLLIPIGVILAYTVVKFFKKIF